jgi:hypothetical protein
VEHRPTLSILRIVSRLLSGSPSLYDYHWALRHKRPPGPGTSLRSTLLQDLASTTTNGSRAVQSIKDSSSGLSRDHVLLDPAYTATNGSTAVCGHAPKHYSSRRRPPGPGDYTCKWPWPSRCIFSVIKFDSQSTHLLCFPRTGLLPSTTTRSQLHRWALRTYTSRQRVLISWKSFYYNSNKFIITLFILHMSP